MFAGASRLVKAAGRFTYQIRQHADGTYQVFRGRYRASSSPFYTTRGYQNAVLASIRART